MRLLASAAVAALALAGCAHQGVALDGPDAGPPGDAGTADAGTSDAGSDAGTASLPDGGAISACKRGVAYNHENGADAPAFQQGIGWWYDWGSSPDAAEAAPLLDAGVEYVPMIWTGPPNTAIDAAALEQSIPQGARFLLGFNEPNFGTQGNLTPAQAAADWPALEQIAKARGLKLVSPAPNYCGGNCNETDPFNWLDAFFAACPNCQVDYVAFHWYSCYGSSLTTMLQKYEAYGRPVWVTELSCLDGSNNAADNQTSYMKQAIPILEADAKVFRYSWFIGRGSPNADPYDIFGGPGSLSELGSLYVSFPGKCAE